MVIKARYLAFFTIIISSLVLRAQNDFPDINKGRGGQIEYIADRAGNTIPDFSFAGYKKSSQAIPNISARVLVQPVLGDATTIIQNAIDYVGTLKPDENGFRGTVLLAEGTFNIKGTLYLDKSGVVLRGSGNSESGSILFGTGIRREAMIRVLGKNDINISDTLSLDNDFIPLGSKAISLKEGHLSSGDLIFIEKALDQAFLDSLQMNDFGAETGWIGWKAKDWDISWDREIITSKNGKLELSAPLTMELHPNAGNIKILKYQWPGRIRNVGIENLKVVSEYNHENIKDEQHRWLGISIENAKDVWIRRINFENLAGGAVHIIKSSKQVTVEDCISMHPVSEIAAFRRHTFYTEGQQTLFQRCYSEYGYHDFAVGGYGTTGPNVFLQCESYLPHSFSGSIGSWATGVLFDMVTIDGDALSFANQGQLARGTGWTAANSVIWETSASMMQVPNPPLANNWAFGTWGQYSGNGHWKDVNSHISPRSLFYAQLEKRLSDIPIAKDLLEIGSEPSSSPTLQAAEILTREAENPKITLKEWIENANDRNPIAFNNLNAANFEKIESKKRKNEALKNLESVKCYNGVLISNNQLLAGKNMNVMWWRGSLRDDDIKKATPHITRFVPGRRGMGLTDNLEESVYWLKDHDIVSLDHNYGLWYDRRMDDHQRVRRYDADTWPPFYEQPFDRSGQGIAWDHLSKYDLTKYNKWYWYRLKQFARLAEPEGIMLFHEQYFQHNIIEAGAHWSSSPWRSANNINTTQFPEPPPYAGDKRIFMARQFYDITNLNRRKLHESYIRKSLDNFKEESNVIQFTSAEYTGPLHFMQFWVDVVKDWESTNDNEGLIGLSATKDVQDAILLDKDREKIIDVIDIKYWYYRENGETYQPLGGQNLAPRQHARKMQTGKESIRSVYRAIREYREKYPNKIVLYNTNGAPRFGWGQLMATGSLPNIPEIPIESFYSELPQMNFISSEDYKSSVWTLQHIGYSYLYYLHNQNNIELNLQDFKGKFQVYVIDPISGNTVKRNVIKGGSKLTLTPTEEEKIFFIIKL